MIIMKLKGGLGNQLFQYAFGRALSLTHNQTLFFNLTEYENIEEEKFLRPYQIGCYDIRVQENISWFAKKRINASKKKRTRSSKIFTFLFPVLAIEESGFHYQPNIASFKSGQSVMLDGYWQSEKYFKDHRQQILKELQLTKSISTRSTTLLNSIQNSNSVAVHIRRGDYILNPAANAVHGTCSLNYYHNSISYISQKLSNPMFYFFSDDMDWVKANFVTSENFIFTDSKELLPAEEDLLLMSACKHQIIANSSFSWWGGWMNSNPEKIVIAPKAWFRDKQKNTDDLIPENWLKMKG